MYKKISFRSVPKPGPGNRAGFFIARRRGTPKTPWLLEARRRGPKRKRFLAAASPHPKPQNQQRSEENAPISERPKRKYGRPAARLAQARDEHDAEHDRGRGGKHSQARRLAGRGGQRGRHP